MRVNIFEGARRIALLCGAIWLACCIGYAALNMPVPHLLYQVDGSTGRIELVDACSAATVRRETFESGPTENWRATVCHVGQGKQGEGRDMSIQLFGGAPEVIERERNAVLRKHIFMTAKIGFGLLAVGWLFVLAVGWIVRGFLGIPRGRDSRIEAPDGGR